MYYGKKTIFIYGLYNKIINLLIDKRIEESKKLFEKAKDNAIDYIESAKIIE
jgi:hypothetical protein